MVKSLLVTSKTTPAKKWYTYLVGGFKIHTYVQDTYIFSTLEMGGLYTVYIVYSMYIHSIYTYIHAYIYI